MVEHLLTYPGSRCDQIAGGALLYEAQILFNCAVRVCVHLHGLQIAAYQRHQARKYAGLQIIG